MALATQPLRRVPQLAASPLVRHLHQPFCPTRGAMCELCAASAGHIVSAPTPLRRLSEVATTAGPVPDRHRLRLAMD